jgi:flagellar protein FlaJ
MLWKKKGRKEAAKAAELKSAAANLEMAKPPYLRDWRMASVVAIGIALAILILNVLLFSRSPQLFAGLNGIAAAVALGLPLFVRYEEYRKIKDLELHFPNFMRDVTQAINVGMSLPRAIENASANDYGRLSPYVKEMSAKLDWGIPFEKVLTSFAEKARSKTIARSVKGIIEAHNSGGTIGTVLQAMTVSVRELENIKRERATRVYGQMVTGYFIYFLFLGIMLALARFLIPPLLAFQVTPGPREADIGQIFVETFRSLVVIQGIFAGIGIGKMSEGSIVAGFKHAVALALIGYTVFVIF